MMTARRGGRQPIKVQMSLACLGLLGGTILSTGTLAMPANPLQLDRHQPADLSAQEVVYDRDLGLVIARGQVKIVQGGERLEADTVTYNQRLDAVTASGHVRMTNARGDVAYADYTELSDAMKEGFAQRVRVLQQDASRFSADRGQRRPGLTILEKAAYSPCKQCQADPNEPLTWYIKANQVVLNEVTENVSYEGATLLIRDVPVAYVPYLQHPSPTVKRRSGLLAPRIVPHSPRLGFGIGLPYFWAISPHQDLTLQPFFFTQETPLLSGNYRQRFNHGSLKVNGSYIQPDHLRGSKRLGESETWRATGKPRWHVTTQGRYDVNDRWRLKMEANRLSDPTYYRHYPLFGHQSDTILDSVGRAQYFHNLQYGALEAYAFQNLAEGARSRQIPRVLPRGIISLASQPGAFGERWRLDASTLSIYRHQGINTQRLSTLTTLALPYIHPAGHDLLVEGQLQADAYYTEYHAHSSVSAAQLAQARQAGQLDRRGRGRIFPRLSATWRYPLIRQDGDQHYMISPLVGIISAPQSLNKRGLPNEDSRDWNGLDDSNILNDNPLPGKDRVYEGTRLNYGLELSTNSWGNSTLFVGQTYSWTHTPLGKNNPAAPRTSDYVIRLMTTPVKPLFLTYRTRLDRRDLHCHWNEVGALLGPRQLTLSTHYLFLNRQANTVYQETFHTLKQGMSSQFRDHWVGAIQFTRDLKLQRQLSHEASLRYKDDCFEAAANIKRSFYRVPGIKPGVTMTLSCDFKTLGPLSYKRTLEKAPTLGLPLVGSHAAKPLPVGAAVLAADSAAPAA